MLDLLAGLALAQAASAAVPPAAPVDYSVAQPVGGSWSYAALADGSEAHFKGASGQTQLSLRCTRSTRRVTIAKAASAAAPSLFVWTSSATRTLPVSFDPAALRLNVQLVSGDPLLDAMVFSRGRVALAAGGAPALVVPPWPELARVVEDCRM